MQTGSADALTRLLVDAITAGVSARFEPALQQKTFDPNDVSAGRSDVEAYVPYVHDVEKMWDAASVTVRPSQCGGPVPFGGRAGHHH